MPLKYIYFISTILSSAVILFTTTEQIKTIGMAIFGILMFLTAIEDSRGALVPLNVTEQMASLLIPGYSKTVTPYDATLEKCRLILVLISVVNDFILYGSWFMCITTGNLTYFLVICASIIPMTIVMKQVHNKTAETLTQKSKWLYNKLTGASNR